MPKTQTNYDRHPKRAYFVESESAMPMPDLIEVQKNSYDWFMRQGLAELFEEFSPITDFIGRDLELDFGEYYFDEPKFNEMESKAKNITYEASLRVKATLKNKKSEAATTQEIFLGDFPLITRNGTFIINGIERVIVSQLIRSAGVIFGATSVKGKKCYSAKIIPNRGAWIELEADSANVIWARIDRKRKVAATSLLRAFGFGSNEEIKALFTGVDGDGEDSFIDATLGKDIATNEEDGLIEVYKRIRPGDLATADNAKSLIHSMFFRFDRYDFDRVGRYKLNKRFSFNIPNNKETRVFRREDLVAIMSELIRLSQTQCKEDDIDHLATAACALLANFCKIKPVLVFPVWNASSAIACRLWIWKPSLLTN
jgi:DNA-directed RNA polymerase subunit beta